MGPNTHRLLCHWDVDLPPPNRKKFGKILVPTISNKVNNIVKRSHKRRITLEIAPLHHKSVKEEAEIAKAKLISGMLLKNNQGYRSSSVDALAKVATTGIKAASTAGGVMLHKATDIAVTTSDIVSKTTDIAAQGYDVAAHGAVSAAQGASRAGATIFQRQESKPSEEEGKQKEKHTTTVRDKVISASKDVAQASKEIASGMAIGSKEVASGVTHASNAVVTSAAYGAACVSRDTARVIAKSNEKASHVFEEMKKENPQATAQSNNVVQTPLSPRDLDSSSPSKKTPPFGSKHDLSSHHSFRRVMSHFSTRDEESVASIDSMHSMYVDEQGLGRGSILEVDHTEITTPEEILKEELKPSDTLLMRVLGRKKKGKKRGKQSEVGKCVLGDDSSSSSSDSSGSDSDDDSSGSDDEDETARLRKERMEAAKKIANTDFLSDDKAEVWVEKQSYVMDDIKILKRRRNKVEAIIGRGNDAEVRQLIFQCEVQAENFNSIMEFAGKLENARAFREDYSYRQLKLDELESNDGKEELAAAKDTTVNQIKILAEIVSASNLPISDSGSSDPYVSVFLGKKLIHQTKEIRRHLNPVWTMTTGSLFILRVPTEDFFKASGLTFLVFDHDVVAKDSILGKVTVPHADVLGGKGEREEYPLFTKKGRNNIFGSGIALRFRPATHDDVYFVSSLLGGQKARRHKWHAKSGIHSSTSFLPPRVKEYSLVRQEVKRNRKKKEVKFRVKPWPDPLRSGETKWMTKTELTNECMKPATHWIEVGSGGIGKLFVEILHGDDLPNFDVSHLVISAKSDFFVNLLFEDCIANTEVINDTCSPRWMPWSRRSFIFRIKHPSSQLFLGIFDFDSESKITQHTPAGRTAVNLTNFHPMVDYTLDYGMYNSANTTTRKLWGTLTIRLRIEWDDNRNALLYSRNLPKPTHIGIKKVNDFHVAYYTVHGEGTVDDLDLNLLTAYRDELYNLANLEDPIRDNLLHIVFWRGHFPVYVPIIKRFRIDFRTVLVPLNSMIAFWAATRLAENFELIPSYICLGGAWFLLSMMGMRQKEPIVWKRSRTFLEIWISLITGTTLGREIHPDDIGSISKTENFFVTGADDEDLDKQGRLFSKMVDKDRRHYRREVNSEKHSQVATKRRAGGLATANPLKPYLLQVQQQLARTCGYLRLARSIVEWDDSYTAFLLTNGLIVAGLLLMWVPWTFLIRWTARLVAWAILGPWMKIVDVLYFETFSDLRRRRKINRIWALGESLKKEKSQALIENEANLKMHDVIRYYFGENIVSPPPFKQYIHKDNPLDSSFAVPATEKMDPRIVKKVDGQRILLGGEMIPQWIGAANWEHGLAEGVYNNAAAADDETVGTDVADETTTALSDSEIFFPKTTENSAQEKLSTISELPAWGNNSERRCRLNSSAGVLSSSRSIAAGVWPKNGGTSPIIELQETADEFEASTETSRRPSSANGDERLDLNIPICANNIPTGVVGEEGSSDSVSTDGRFDSSVDRAKKIERHRMAGSSSNSRRSFRRNIRSSKENTNQDDNVNGPQKLECSPTGPRQAASADSNGGATTDGTAAIEKKLQNQRPVSSASNSRLSFLRRRVPSKISPKGS